MATKDFGVRVLGVAPDRRSVRLRVFVLEYVPDDRTFFPLPEEPVFFLRLLWDWACDDALRGADRPIAEIPSDSLFDEGWAVAHVWEYIERVDRIAGRNTAPDDEAWAHREPYAEVEDGGWPGEQRLAQADYLLRVTDPRWLAGLEPGRSSDTAMYGSLHTRMRPEDAPYAVDFSNPAAMLVPFDGLGEPRHFGSALVFSDDGRHLAVAGQEGDVVVYATDGWAEKARFNVPSEGYGFRLTWVPESPIVVARYAPPATSGEPGPGGSGGGLAQVAWDVEAGVAAEAPQQYGTVRSRSGRYRATCGEGPGVEFLSGPSSVERYVLLGIDPEADAAEEPPDAAAVAFSADESRMFAVGTDDRGEDEAWLISVLDPETGRVHGLIPLDTEMVMDIAASPDGRYVLVAEAGRGLIAEPTLRRVADGGVVARAWFRRLTGRLAWSPDGRFIAADVHDNDHGPSEVRVFAVGVSNPRVHERTPVNADTVRPHPRVETAAGSTATALRAETARLALDLARAVPAETPAAGPAPVGMPGSGAPALDSPAADGTAAGPAGSAADVAVIESLRRIASGEDPELGPLAAVLAAALDATASEPAPPERAAGLERAPAPRPAAPASGSAAPASGSAPAPSSEPVGELLRGVGAELVGALSTARAVYRSGSGPLAKVSLARVLAREGREARARELLAEVQETAAPLISSYAGYLLGGSLIASGEGERAEAVLRQALATAGETRQSPYGLAPWIGIRLGELLVDRPAELDAIREAFAHAQPLYEIAAPALATVGMGALDASPYAVRGALADLRPWGAERHAAGCRLAVRLGSRLVETSPNPGDHPLDALFGGPPDGTVPEPRGTGDPADHLDGDPEAGAYGAWVRARRRRDAGDWEGAIAGWERVAGTGLLPYARWAGSCLAVMYTIRNDGDRAEHALRHGVAAIRVVELGDAFREAGHHEDARVAYELAETSDTAEAAGRAALGLGHLFRADAQWREAADAYRRAAELVGAGRGVLAAYHLSDVLEKLGDGGEAIAAAREAYERGVAEGISGAGLARLARRAGDLLRRARDWPGSTEAYRACLAAWREETDEQYPHQARWPLLYLGAVEGLGEEYEASARNLNKVLEIFAEPEDAEERELAVMARLHLGMNAKFRRDLDSALPYLTQVIDSGDENHGPTALAHLAELYYWLDQKVEAARLYERTLEVSDNPEYVAEAAYRLAEYLVETADPVDSARVTELLQRTLASSYTGFHGDARALLARVGTLPGRNGG